MSWAPSGALRDAVVIVTGGASGIGLATCRSLARAGACVVAVGRSRQRLDEAMTELAEFADGGDRHLGLPLDVSSEADMKQMAEAVVARFGRIDALVACAGILRADGNAVKPLAQVTAAEWDQLLDINLKGMYLSNRAVLPAMLKQRRGDIINLSSIRGRQGRAYDGPYSASKFGIIGMSEALAEEVAGAGIRVQVVLPGAVATPIWLQNGFISMPSNAIPPERVADLILFMLTLPVDCRLLTPAIVPCGGDAWAA
jgi:NAD(P)-dependent dehydrogenase (short-subunit alcohol dehydrogenase family)